MKRLFINLLLCSLILIGCESRVVQPPVIITPRAVTLNTLGYQEQWRYSLSFLGLVSESPKLFVVDDQLIFQDDTPEDPSFKSWLVSLRLQDGKELWRTGLDDPGFGTLFGSYLIDPQKNYLYVEYSFRLHAFDLNTGKKVWSTDMLGGHTGYSFYPDTFNPLKVLTTQEEIFFVNPKNGEIIEKKSLSEPSGYYFLMPEHDQVLFIASQEWLRAIDRDSLQVLWEYPSNQPANRQLIYWPFFVDNDMIYQTGGPIYTIRRVDLKTGTLIWESKQNFISNMTLSGRLIYCIDETGRLEALDSQDGQIIGAMEFDRTPVNVGSRAFWVVAEDAYLVVGWGDNSEILVFKK